MNYSFQLNSPYRPITIRDPLQPPKFSSSSTHSSSNWFSTQRISKRVPFRDRPDIFRGRYFAVTLIYGLFYIIGGIVGYSRRQNMFCLGPSVACGLLLIIFALLHAVDYYRGASIEAIYIMIPLVLSLFVAILMSCIYAMGSTFSSSIVVSVTVITAWTATCIYFYAAMKDYGGGKYYRVNDFHLQGLPTKPSASPRSEEELARLLLKE